MRTEEIRRPTDYRAENFEWYAYADRMEMRVAELEGALRFYANRPNWAFVPGGEVAPVRKERGARARKALGCPDQWDKGRKTG